MGVMKRLSEQIKDTRRRSGGLDMSKGLPFELKLESNSEVDRYHRVQDKDRLNAFHEAVYGWAIDVTKQLKSSVRMLVRDDRELSDSIDPMLYKKKGEISRIGFSFKREGVYIHKGAGRGQGGFRGGSKWTTRQGKLKQTDPLSFYKMGTGNRKPIEWFDPVIERNIQALAEIVADYSVDMQVDATRIYINR